ncbi:HCP-like protein [Gigaspora margarita]|uniref:HCP-like protein n=1 Tax=Gigaspora margarita TaxID=4874 RepID=A0A8H3ZZJ6_GIGMA|nr:HCP-like protein [Gigaspora margarita]
MMKMKSEVVFAKSIGKREELNKLKNAGVDVKKNEHKMFIYYQKLSNMGDLGRVSSEIERYKAFSHYQKSAKGNIKAQDNLGLYYQYEISTDKNEKVMFEWNLKNIKACTYV